jgi:hypothetical protein
MKRRILALLVFLFTVSASGLAQQTNVAKTVCDKWKQEAPARVTAPASGLFLESVDY